MKKIYLSFAFILLALNAVLAQCNITAQTFVNKGASCFGSCDGSAGAFAFGGTAPYTYIWMPGNISGANPTTLCAGIYTVIVADSKGCTTTSQPLTITQPQSIALSFTTIDETCNGGTNGSIKVS